MAKVALFATLSVMLVAGELWCDRAPAAPLPDQTLRHAAGRVVDAVACRRHVGHRHHCAPAAPADSSSAGRLDASGLPDSRRRFSRW
jgi:hypothetical protein